MIVVLLFGFTAGVEGTLATLFEEAETLVDDDEDDPPFIA